VRVFLAIMVVVLILLLIFAVQNPGSTKVTFLSFSSTVSLLLIILISTVVGFLLGLAVLLPSRLRRSSQLRSLDSELRTTQARLADEVAAQRTTPPAPADTGGGTPVGED
jgi:uncharacterized integral membrane protein